MSLLKPILSLPFWDGGSLTAELRRRSYRVCSRRDTAVESLRDGGYEWGIPNVYREASGHSDADALNNFAAKLSLGSPADKSEAVDFFRKAATQGHAIAQNNLGVILA